MITPEIQAKLAEVGRLAALAETGLLDRGATESLERYVRLVNLAIGVPVTLVSLVDDHRQFHAARHGMPELPASLPLSHSFCKHVVADGEPLVVMDAREHPVLRDNGSVEDSGVVAYAGIPIRTDDGFVVGAFCAVDLEPREWTDREIGILTDLAEGVSEEMNLRRRATRAERAERRLAEAATQLRELSDSHARAVLHDIRTPLSVLSLGVSTLVEHEAAQEHPELRNLLAVLDRNIAHARTLATAMAERGGGPGELEPVDVGALAREVAGDLEAAAGVAFHLSTPPTPGCVRMPPSELRRCMENLMTNARRFATERIEVGVAIDGDEVRFEVSDDGPGLPTEGDYGLAWGSSVRFHEDTGQSGSGLGLAVVSETVERAGGSVLSGPSELGGARFGFSLPLA